MVGKPGGPPPRNLPGNQEKIDANKNGQIDANDFKLLRAKKAKVEEDYLWTEAKKAKKSAPEETTGVDNYASGAVKMFPNDSEKKSGVMNAGFEMGGPVLSEKAMSKAQQRFMGMVYAAKKGEEPASPEVAQAAAGMSKAEAKKFAKTKHKGLPEKKGKKKSKK